MSNILGVSIGTRNVGVAIIRLNILTDYRIRTFAGKWTDRKCQSIVDVLESLIKRNAITDFTLKIPDASHCSPGITLLLKRIKELTDKYKIEIHHCTIRDINLCFTNEKHGGKKVMVASLIEKYPELGGNWSSNSSKQRYKARLFEAIACAELALRAGH